MADKRLTLLSDCTEVLFFRALIEAIKADPTLISQGVSFWESDGEREQTPPQQGGGGVFLPCEADIGDGGLVEFIPGDIVSVRDTESTHLGTWPVTINCYAPGLHDDDILNLCAAVRVALFSAATKAILDETIELVGRPTLNASGKSTIAIGVGKYAKRRTMILTTKFRFAQG